MKVIYSKYFPPKNFVAINFFGLIIGRAEYGRLSDHVLYHEEIHSYQIREMLWIFFYLFYIIEWIIRIAQYKDITKAYYNISFEREAYQNDNDLEYLKNRKKYSFIRYLKKTA